MIHVSHLTKKYGATTAVTGLHGMKAQCFSFGMKFRPLGKDQTPKIDLTFSPNCGIIRVSRWRPTFVALPLGNVSVSYPLQRG